MSASGSFVVAWLFLFIVEAIWTMFAAIFATISALQVVLLCENNVSLFTHVMVFGIKLWSPREPAHVFTHGANFVNLRDSGKGSCCFKVDLQDHLVIL